MPKADIEKFRMAVREKVVKPMLSRRLRRQLDEQEARKHPIGKQPKFRLRPYFCDWSANGDADTWDTSCSNAFLINDHETPEKAGMRYCCFCGGEIRQHI